jgi:hypothetical protein
MIKRLLWRIGDPEALSPDLVDNFGRPDVFGAAEWHAGQPSQRWPLFHASEADPEGGYRFYPHTVVFALEAEPAPAYRLRVHHFTITPRLGHLEVRVNGVAGLAFPRPAPTACAVMRLKAALHTSIYAEGVTDIVVPGALLRPGENRLTLICHDGAAFTHVESADKRARLDRMATGAGLFYRAVELSALAAAPEGVIRRVTLVPSVVYRRDEQGTVRGRCELFVELGDAFDGGEWRVDASDGRARLAHTLRLPPARFGYLRAAFDLPEGEGPVEVVVAGEANGGRVEQHVTLARKRRWQVFAAPGLHTDIGYTHRQWEVAERLSLNLDRALDLLDGAEPEAFAYHLDSAFTLDHFLATRGPERREQLLRHARTGRLGVPGNYVILLSHLAGLEDLIRNHVRADTFLRQAGLRARFDAVVDVPSLSGALPAVLAGCGVRYLVHASNQDRGPFRLNGGLHRQSPFYWQGPAAGGSVLVWLSRMYCEVRKVCGSPPDVASAERGLALWLDEFERETYAPSLTLLYGQEADNTDLDPQPIDFVREWNRTYAYPELVPCAVTAYFERVEAECGQALPTVRGDGGAYWEDGAGSSLGATIEARQAQANLPAAERLAAMAALYHPDQVYPLDEFDQAWRQVLLYDEHTWGAFLSGSDPDARLQRDQWSVKAHMAESARQWSERLLHGATTRHSLSWNARGREVVVFNPHSWTVSGAVTVEIALDESVVDAGTGAAVPARRVSASESQAVVALWIEALPGLGYRRHRLVPGATAAALSQSPPLPAAGLAPIVIESAHYRLTLDARRGCAISLVDKALDRELAAPGAYGLGQFLYVSGGEGTTITGNHPGLPPAQLTVHDTFELERCEVQEDALGARVLLTGRVAAGRLEVEWSLPAHAARVDLAFTYHKPSVTALEAAYVAFPLDLPGATVESDAQLGWVDWNSDTLPGACQEWLPLQTGVLLTGANCSLWFGSPDVPLFTVGDIVRGRWRSGLDVRGGRLFSYVLNNYWRTNYRGEQAGPLVFRYSLASGRAISHDRAYRMGWEARRPLYAQRLSLQEFREARAPYDQAAGILASVTPEQVAVSTFNGARHAPGYVLRLLETSGADQTAEVAFPYCRITRAWEVDLLEYERRALPVEAGRLRVPVPAWGMTTIRLELESELE